MAKKVLIIEDDTALAENLSSTIKAGGMEVLVCHDGEAGFRQAEEKKPDLILLDLVLPKKHGFKVMEDLKKNQNLKPTPVVVLTNLERTTTGMDLKFGFFCKSSITLKPCFFGKTRSSKIRSGFFSSACLNPASPSWHTRTSIPPAFMVLERFSARAVSSSIIKTFFAIDYNIKLLI